MLGSPADTLDDGGFAQRVFELIGRQAGALQLTTTDGDEVRFCSVTRDLADVETVSEALLHRASPVPNS